MTRPAFLLQTNFVSIAYDNRPERNLIMIKLRKLMSLGLACSLSLSVLAGCGAKAADEQVIIYSKMCIRDRHSKATLR